MDLDRPTDASPGADGITVFDAIDKQLGLKLEPKQVPQPVVQIVSVNRTPSILRPIPPGVATWPCHLRHAGRV